MARKKKNPEPELTPYEKAGMYTVLSEEIREHEKVVTIRTYGGATVIMHIPIRPIEEEYEWYDNFVIACAKMVHHGKDISGVKFKLVP